MLAASQLLQGNYALFFLSLQNKFLCFHQKVQQ